MKTKKDVQASTGSSRLSLSGNVKLCMAVTVLFEGEWGKAKARDRVRKKPFTSVFHGVDCCS